MSVVDLDELVLLVKHPTPKEYIREAVNAYRGGAMRAAIISTWIAVVFDIIEKMRELELTGDAQAQGHLEAFDRAHRSGDISAALRFEKTILDVAIKDFEFISQQEYEDLRRLQVDRNRCAHPTMASDGIYSPSAELARYHMHTAVVALLQHPPVQGKKALDRLMSDVNSPYFPNQPNKAVEAFQSGPLQRPKSSLVTNFVKVLLKGLLNEGLTDAEWSRYHAALEAIHVMRGAECEAVLRDNLSEYIRQRGDALANTVKLLWDDSEIWGFIDIDVQDKVRAFVRACPDDDLETVIGFSVLSSHLKVEACVRLETVTPGQLEGLINQEFIIPAEYVDKAIDFYTSSNLYSSTNRRATGLMEPCIDEMTQDQVEKVLKSISTNSQLLGARTTLGILRKLKKHEGFEVTAMNLGLDRLFPGLIEVPEEDDDEPF